MGIHSAYEDRPSGRQLVSIIPSDPSRTGGGLREDDKMRSLAASEWTKTDMIMAAGLMHVGQILTDYESGD